MKQVLIIGAGGHAQVAADILLRMADVGMEVEPIGYLDDDPRLLGSMWLGLPVLGPTAALDLIAHDAVLIAIGHNQTRRRLYERFRARGEQFIIARHPSAIIAPDVQIGAGTVIAARATVNPGARIGANVILNTGCIVEHHNRIGAHAHIAPGATLGGDVVVGEGALIGIGATVLPQGAVGDWSTVGGGALVAEPVGDGITVAGVPARLLAR